MDVRRRAQLERDPLVADQGGEAAETRVSVGPLGRDVVHDADPVAESFRAADLERLPDRGKPEGLAGVDREVEVLAADVLEGVEVARRRKPRLGARDVEPDDAAVA